MDPVTHAASGAVAMLALSRRPSSRWALPLAALAAASPDVDVALAHTPLQFLLLHRGITHSLAFAPLLGLTLAMIGFTLWRGAATVRWSFAKTWLFMTAMVLLHIWLDCITTYGTMIFVPFSHLRVRLNAVFIIDPLLTLPLLWAIWRWRARRGLALLAFAWIFLYPGLNMGLNAWHTAQTRTRLTAEGHAPGGLVVLPDVFAPFFWRAIYEENSPEGMRVHTVGLNALGDPHGATTTDPALPTDLGRSLARQSVIANAFLRFTLLPVVLPLPPRMWPSPMPPSRIRGGETPTAQPHTAQTLEDLPPLVASNNATAGAPPTGDAAPRFVMIYDLRFGSNLPFMRRLMAMRPNADIPFKYMAELVPVESSDQTDPAGGPAVTAAGPPPAAQSAPPVGEGWRLVRERLRFSDSRHDSLWHRPRPPSEPSLWLWLVGLR